MQYYSIVKTRATIAHDLTVQQWQWNAVTGDLELWTSNTMAQLQRMRACNALFVQSDVRRSRKPSNWQIAEIIHQLTHARANTTEHQTNEPNTPDFIRPTTGQQ